MLIINVIFNKSASNITGIASVCLYVNNRTKHSSCKASSPILTMLLLRFFMILFTSLVAGNIAPDSYQKPLESERSQALSSPDSDRVYEAYAESWLV